MRHNESRLQEACVRWFRYQYPEFAYMLVSVPNGVVTTETQMRILKQEGLVVGVSDLLLLVPRHGKGCLCIEMKTEKGRQSEHQKEWQKHTEEAGNLYVVVRSFEQFRQVVCDYLFGGVYEDDKDVLQRIINSK